MGINRKKNNARMRMIWKFKKIVDLKEKLRADSET